MSSASHAAGSPQQHSGDGISHSTRDEVTRGVRTRNGSRLPLSRELAVLREAHEDVAFALDLHAMLTVTHRDGTFLEVNDYFARVTGYSAEQLIGEKFDLLTSDFQPPEFWDTFWDTVRRGNIWQGEMRTRTASGGACWLYCTTVPMFDGHDSPQRFFNILNDITLVREAEAKIRKIAYTDQLTGLANRAAMIEEMSECVVDESNGACALITISLEDFQMLNDAFGHATGERFIQKAAERLQALDPKPSLLARTDLDVFALVYHDLGQTQDAAAEQAEAIANTVITDLNHGLELDGGATLQPAIRVGYGLSSQARTLGGAAVLNQADAARHRSLSSRGLQRPVRFSTEIAGEIQHRVNTVLDLRRAVTNNEFRLYRQPIVDVDGETTGYELLLRWEHPERGLVPPNHFIPLAEQSGLILEIGDWVVEEACRTLAERKSNPHLIDVPLSINVSEYQLRVGTFVDKVKAALLKYGPRPSMLCIEVTETLLHVDIDRSIAQLEQLRELGVKISLDDFGTGFSSLSYLPRLPVHEVKIDRSFIAALEHDDGQTKFVQGIVKLAHIMGLSTVAEGVENEAQFQRLRSMGADRFQGFAFGKPEPV